MKRAVILLILLFTLSLAGCVCAAALVNSAQDKAHFEPETLAGDPALCEGVSVRRTLTMSPSSRTSSTSSWTSTPPPARRTVPSP